MSHGMNKENIENKTKDIFGVMFQVQNTWESILPDMGDYHLNFGGIIPKEKVKKHSRRIVRLLAVRIISKPVLWYLPGDHFSTLLNDFKIRVSKSRICETESMKSYIHLT